MKLQEAVCIVTGGGTGTGAACAVQLARKGARVVVNYSRSEAEARARLLEDQAPTSLYGERLDRILGRSGAGKRTRD